MGDLESDLESESITELSMENLKLTFYEISDAFELSILRLGLCDKFRRY